MEEPTWDWLRSTYRLQSEHFGVPLAEDGSGIREGDGETLANYVTWNATALNVELGEALTEVGWKPWSEPRGWVNRDKFVGELVDVGHFLANLLVAVGVTDEEWASRYQQKQQVNRERQARGYDTRVEKCPACGRAYDDDATLCKPASVFTDAARPDFSPYCEDYGTLDVTN